MIIIMKSLSGTSIAAATRPQSSRCLNTVANLTRNDCSLVRLFQTYALERSLSHRTSSGSKSIKLKPKNSVALSAAIISHHEAHRPYSIVAENPSQPGTSGRQPTPSPGDTVHLAMSGGVDSSVVALLMKRLSDSMSERGEAPLTLKPVYMRNWSTLEESGSFEPGSGGAAGCEWQKEFEAVQQVCKTLHLPEPRLIDLTKEYWRDVFGPSLDMWQAGQTPNPDVVCNRVIKFGALLDRLIPPEARQSQHLDQTKSWLATGHYGKLIYPEGSALPQLHQAVDPSKDQSYFLSAVSASQLAHALFPIADLLKTQTKQLARDAGLPTAAAKESMGLCFVGKRDTRTIPKTPEEEAAEEAFRQANKSMPSPNRPSFGKWLSSFVSDESPYTRPGIFVDANLKTIGHHGGLHTLTIGQNSRIPGLSEKHFVARKTVVDGLGLAIIVPGKNHPMLQCAAIRIATDRFHWVNDTDEAHIAASPTPVKLAAKIRYLEGSTPCHVTIIQATDAPSPKALYVKFDESNGAPLPIAASAGQVLALYDGTRCLGSGVIPLDDDRVGIELKQLHTHSDHH